MPTRCVAIGCINTTDANRKPAAQIEMEKVMKITFHSFPSDLARRAEWIKIMRLENKPINHRSRLCSIHFEEKYIDRTSLVYVRLKENAVPHIIEETWCEEMENKTSIRDIMKELPLQRITAPKSAELVNIKAEMENEPIPVHAYVIRKVSCNKETNTSLSFQETRKSTLDKETRISPERLWDMNSSTLQGIRKVTHIEIESLRKRIRTLQHKLARKKKKIEIMKNILKLKVETLINDEII